MSRVASSTTIDSFTADRVKLVQLLNKQRLTCTPNCTQQATPFPLSTSSEYKDVSTVLRHKLMLCLSVTIAKTALSIYSDDWKVMIIDLFKQLALDKQRIPTRQDIVDLDFKLATKSFFDKYSSTGYEFLLNEESFTSALLLLGKHYQEDDFLGTRCYHSIFEMEKENLDLVSDSLAAQIKLPAIQQLVFSVLEELESWRINTLGTDSNWQPEEETFSIVYQNRKIVYLYSEWLLCRWYLHFITQQLLANQLYYKCFNLTFVYYSDFVLFTRAAIHLYSCSVTPSNLTQQPSHLYKNKLLNSDPSHWFRYIMSIRMVCFDVPPEIFLVELGESIETYSIPFANYPNLYSTHSTKSKYIARQARKKALIRFNQASIALSLETVSIINLTYPLDSIVSTNKFTDQIETFESSTAQLTSFVEDLSISSPLNAVEEVVIDASEEAESQGVDELKEDEWIPELIDTSDSEEE